MKKGMFLMIFALISIISLPAFAETVVDDLRIVNTSALDPFEYQKYLDDDDLRRLAELSVSENPTLFPTIKSFEASTEGVAAPVNQVMILDLKQCVATDGDGVCKESA